MLKLLRNLLRKILSAPDLPGPAQKVEEDFFGFKIIGSASLVRIGANTSFGGGVKIFANSMVTIGDHTMIAVDVTIHTSTHNYKNHPMWMERVDRPIQIGRHVWIGIGAIITPGVIIEDYAVVGAGSIVLSNVPTKAIVAGNPARIIKYRDLAETDLYQEIPPYPEQSFITEGDFLEVYCKQKGDD